MSNRFLGFLKTKSTGISVTNFLNGSEHRIDARNLNTYKESLYLYIAVSKIARRAAGIPLQLYKVKNRRGDTTEILDHALLDLFYNPNPIQTQREFLEQSISHYLLTGDCIWLLERNGAKISGIVALRPDHVDVILSEDGSTILAYEYRASRVYRYKPEDIIHIRNTDPTNPIRGVGVVRPASYRILSENEATKYQASWMQNQGRPDFAVFTEGILTDEQAEEGRARWKQRFSRFSSAAVAFFGGNVKTIQELNKTPKELDFIETQKFLRDDILAALSVPKGMVTSDDVNLANAKEAYRMFLQEAVVPTFEAFVDKINNVLCPQFDVSLFFDFRDPTPVDREALLKEATELKKAGIITANEAREMFNYEPMEGADELAMATTAPATSADLADKAKAVIRQRPILAKKLDAIEKVVALIHNTTPQRRMNSVFPTQAAKEAYAKAVNDNIDRKAEGIKDEVDKFHEGMLARVLATDLDFNGFMDPQREIKIAKDQFTPVMQKLYKEGGQAALDALFRKADTHFFADEVLLALIDERVEFFTKSMVETTFEVLKAKIAEGIKEGYGIDKIGRSIREYFDDMSVKRAKTIAQTETCFVLSKATNDAYNQSSVVTGKEWLTVGDDKVRPEHVANNGLIVAKGASFPNGESHPGHHSVNCRCVLLPAV